MTRQKLGAILILIACGLAEMAATPAGAWNEMRLAQGWDQLSPGQRRKAQENYDRWKKMPESRQRQLEDSYQQWRGMGPSEKDRIRRNYDAYRQMSPDQRKQLFRQKGQQ